MGNGKAFPVLLLCMLVAASLGCGSDDTVEQASGETASRLVPATDTGDEVAQADMAGGSPMLDPVQQVSPETETGPGVDVAPVPAQEPDLPAEDVSPPGGAVPDGDEYCLLVGSFRNRDNAESRARQLATDGVRADIVSASVDGVTHHRVRICGLNGAEDARRLGEHLRMDLGIDYLVIRK